MGSHIGHTNFYGTATVGTKGQIVIPAKAREELGIEAGDSMVIIGIKDHNMLGVCPVSSVEAMLEHMTHKLNEIKSVIDKTKETKGK
ncbi:MAG TPA: AbrB/MazE/SpoVT family DNA-binding domain-containing protein [Candidatus Saccharimonadales bacterium]|jgi:AbrB family looped-hinge helix DNA binding protein|nr:AbrB/MazE/SpoVT family DNA-binding domain-containing protein [Candidatus Saccharimonadales bacterium]